MSRVANLACLIMVAAIGQASGQDDGPWIRANQIGYRISDPKIAVLASETPLKGAFTVGEFSSDIGPDAGPWGAIPHHYRLDFTSLTKPGRYSVTFGETKSLPFAIGDDAFRDVPDKLLYFMRLQRCGENPVTGRKCHPDDGVDTVSGKKVDLVGGWHDAGDSLRHMITTSYCAAAFFLTGDLDEARWGAAMVRKLHPDPETIYVQVGDDRDHGGGWRLWHDDKTDYGWGPGTGRAAWRATGRPEGPKYKTASTGLASLAGRCAAVMALAGDVATARSLYRLGQTNPGCAQSVPVKAPHYYGERTYHDDMEWGAVELYQATKEPVFLTEAVRWAHLAHDESWMGKAFHGHYEYFPYVNLAHWRLYDLVDGDEKARIAGYYRNNLEEVRLRAERNPWRVGTPFVWCSTNDVIAFATQAVLYEKMTGDARYRPLAAEARDWIFGRNPWGVSFVTGVGSFAAADVHHPFTVHGGDHPPTGGLVDGPVSGAINDEFKKYFDIKDDPLARFQSAEAKYHRHISDFSTNEPTIDGTVSLLVLLRVW